MKKGFTLVELAIVLVIIGLIMGMAIKGKSLIDVARMRAEVQKISKIEAALAMYSARASSTRGRAGKLPSAPTEGGEDALIVGMYDMKLLVSMGLLSENDMQSAMVDGPNFAELGGPNHYMMVECGARQASNPSAGTPAIGFTDITAGFGSYVCLLGIGMHAPLICSIESFLDNENESTGDARAWGVATSLLTPADYQDCIGIDKDTISFAVNIM